MKNYCPNCNTIIAENNFYCTNCGIQVFKRCSYCGERVPANTKFCIWCGKNLLANTIPEKDNENGYVKSENEKTIIDEPSNRKRGTSLPEQTIYYYVKKFFDDAKNRYKVSGKYEADIYIPSINVAIEYDGSHWHSDDTSVYYDSKKNHFFEDNDIFLIRVRDADLPDLNSFNGVVLKHWKKGYPGLHTNEYITEIMHILSAFCDDENIKVALCEFNISNDDYNKELSNIYALLYDTPCENNATKWELFKYWDYELNGNLDPKCLNMKSRARVWLKCDENKQFQVSVGCVAIGGSPEQKCPLNLFCNDEYCIQNTSSKSALKKYAIDYIDGSVEVSETKVNEIKGLVLERSDFAFYLIRDILNNEYSEDKKERFGRLFFYEYEKVIDNISRRSIFFDNINSIDEFLAIVELNKLYMGSLVQFFVEKIDTCSENRKLIIDYFKWKILEERIPVEQIVNSGICGKITSELYEMLVDLLNSPSINKKCRQQGADTNLLIAKYKEMKK